jgi:sugar porter (SP) family MFS transporter
VIVRPHAQGEKLAAIGTLAVAPESYNLLYVAGITAVAALGGLLFGYDWVVIGGAKPFYESYFNLTSAALIGWANSSALIGCLAGAVLCGALSDRVGRKRPLILSAFLFAVSSVFTGWAHSFPGFVTWRILGGVAIGMASHAAPIYIAEVGPARWRGRLVALNQLTLVVGILLAQLNNWLIAEPVPNSATAQMIRASWNGQWGWRWMFMAVAVPSVIFLCCALFIPESPRWLIQRSQSKRGLEILERIGGADYAQRTLREIQTSIAIESGVGGTVQELLTPRVLGVLVTGIGLAVLQQWSGINILFNYAEEIYRHAGYDLNGLMFNIVITGTVNLVCTLLALLWIDRIGRRALLLLGYAGVACSHLLLGFCYAKGIQGLPILVLTLAAIGCYAMSLAPITWVLISELFPNRIRGLGVSIAVSALWIACFALTFTFPPLIHSVGVAQTFWLYGAICAAGFVFVLLRVPETKGKTLEDIEHELAAEK